MLCSSLVGSSEGDVDLLELVESSQDTSASNTTEDVGSGSLHQRHEALVLQDLREAVDGALVLDSTPGGHHHPPPDGVDGVGHQASRYGDCPSQEEGESHSGISSEDQRLQGVVEPEVHASVAAKNRLETINKEREYSHEDTDSRDGEPSIESLDTIRLEGLRVDINETVELSLAALALGVIGQPGPGIVQRVDEHQRQGPGKPSAGNVGGELHCLGSILGGLEDGLDLILEGKVECLGWEVSQDISQVS